MMIKYNLLSAIILTTLAISCNDKKEDDEALFGFNGSVLKEQYTASDAIVMELTNDQKKAIDSVVYYVNDKKAGATKANGNVSYALKDQKLGYQNLKALVFFEGKNVEVLDRVELVSGIEPKLLSYKVVNVFSHDIAAFTEGLEFYNDTLMESTGKEGTSYIRKLDYKTGKVYKQVDLENRYFGEGITVLNDKIYQLTWQNKTGLIYNAKTMKLEKTFTFSKDIEGWGMTNDGEFLYHSDGTEKIWKMDPATQQMLGNINVYAASNKIKSINELEMVGDKIYGNVWMKDLIAVINPSTGAVEQVLDLSDLKKQLTNSRADVLNGIAYNPKTKTFFVTGKYWDKMFEIKISE